MRFLVKRAAVITPNLTEALLLLHGRERAHKIWSKISNLAEKELKEFVEETGNKLAMEYETEVVITGIDFPVKAGVQEIGNLICAGDSVQWVTAQKVGGSYSWNGRSVCVGFKCRNGERNGYSRICPKSSKFSCERDTRCG